MKFGAKNIWDQNFFGRKLSKFQSWKLKTDFGSKMKFQKKKKERVEIWGKIFVAENFLSSKVGSWKLIVGRKWNFRKKKKKSWNLGPNKFGGKIFWAENFLSISFVNLNKLYGDKNLCVEL